MQPDSEPEVSALPGVPVMIVNDVIWSAGEDVCGYVYLCVQNPAVCVCVHTVMDEDTSSDCVGGHFIWWGDGVLGGAGSVEYNELQCLFIQT